MPLFRKRTAFRVGALIAALAAAWFFAPASYDDSYITYRYADNLARGRGLVFNPGDIVLGTSAPGYALVLSGLARLTSEWGVSVDAWGATLSLAALLAIVLAFPALRTAFGGESRRLPSDPDLESWAFAALVLSARWNLELLGCETLPATALAAWAFVFAARRHSSAALAGLLAGLSAVVRPEFALAGATLFGALWMARGRPPWSFAVAAGLPIAACGFWLWWTFGGVVPHTLAGKRSEMEYAGTSYTGAQWAWLERSFSAVGAVLLLVAAGFGLAALLAALRRRDRSRLFLLAAMGWILAHETFYRIVRVPFAPWYHVVTLQAILALAAYGAAHLGRVLVARASRARGGPVARAVAVTLPVALLLPAILASARFWSDHLGLPPDPRLRIYRDAAHELARRSTPQASVAAVEIGALAYFSDRKVIDLVGLVEPRLLAARREGRLAAELFAQPPDYVLDNPNFHATYLAPLLVSGELDRAYREVARFARPEYPFAIRLLARHGIAEAGLSE